MTDAWTRPGPTGVLVRTSIRLGTIPGSAIVDILYVHSSVNSVYYG